MQRTAVFGALLTAWLLPSAAAAQRGAIDPRCGTPTPVSLPTQDACQKASDLFQFVAPQLGISVVGGNPVLGEVGALGGFGHFSIGLRASSAAGRLPRAEHVTPELTGAVASTYDVSGRSLGLPEVDVAIGLFRGFLLPGSRGLAVDALVNVAWVPSASDRDVVISLPDGALRVGYGARLSLLEESIFTPTIALTLLRRDLPPVDLLVTPGSDALSVNSVDVRTTQWRLLLAKHLGATEFSAGVGQDRYATTGRATVRVTRDGNEFEAGPIGLHQRLTRDNAFVGVGYELAPLRLAVEVGRVSGGSVSTYNTFGTRPADDALAYLSLGARVRW